MCFFFFFFLCVCDKFGAHINQNKNFFFIILLFILFYFNFNFILCFVLFCFVLLFYFILFCFVCLLMSVHKHINSKVINFGHLKTPKRSKVSINSVFCKKSIIVFLIVFKKFFGWKAESFLKTPFSLELFLPFCVNKINK